MDHTKTVGVVGASGIGKHHANWWNTEGARVCAFVGTTPESVEQTHDVLADLFDFDGRGYTDLGELIAEESPDIIDICSPPEFHYDHAMTAIGAGCDVLCEKPLVFNDNVPNDELLDRARTLVNEAETKNVQFGMCSQYHVSARVCSELLEDKEGTGSITAYRGQLASPAGDRSPDPSATWIDLAPHMLAGMQALFPEGRISFGSLSTRFSGHDAKAEFFLQRRDSEDVDCEIVTGRTTEDSETSHIRGFELNHAGFDIGGYADENGVYCAEYETPWGNFQRPDPLRLLIREFMSGTALIDGRTALTNLTWLLRIKAQASA